MRLSYAAPKVRSVGRRRRGNRGNGRGQSVRSDELSYVSERDPLWKRWTMRGIENLSGRRSLLPIYHHWQREVGAGSPRMMTDLLKLIGTRLDIDAPAWPVTVPQDLPLVIVANHPFGIGDGIVVLALAERLDRPFRILVNSDFLKVPEIRPYALPIDFSDTREAMETNLRSRIDARRLLQSGVTIVVFPAGGVATAEEPRGRAEELPWKGFTARLIQQARASVLPVYFEGQNSPLFHMVSRYSLMLRLSLLVSEFRHFVGSTVKVHVGGLIPFSELGSPADRTALTRELYARVHRLAPRGSELGPAFLMERPPELRRRYPWDPPRRPNGQAEA
jgi:putative hemolysin